MLLLHKNDTNYTNLFSTFCLEVGVLSDSEAKRFPFKKVFKRTQISIVKKRKITDVVSSSMKKKLCDFTAAERLAGLEDESVDYLRSIFVSPGLHDHNKTNRMSWDFVDVVVGCFDPSVTLPQSSLNMSNDRRVV